MTLVLRMADELRDGIDGLFSARPMASSLSEDFENRPIDADRGRNRGNFEPPKFAFEIKSGIF
jgi:hypothetical protein